MPEKLRPRYGGVPKAAEAQLAGRRERTQETEVASPSPPPTPALIETRLKAIEDKLDHILEVLQAGSTSADPPPPPTRRKR